MVIAIDGPVASGKTAVGRAIADRINWTMLDTGIMYRALTWYALEQGTQLRDEEALTKLAQSVDMRIERAQPGSVETATIFVDGIDATPHLREKLVEATVSTVAAVRGVRKEMVAQQRRIAQGGKIVMVGRDIGTVVVPQAAVKIYIDASPAVRAKRRADQMRAGGRSVADDDVLDDLRRRDTLDRDRAIAHAQPPDDAARLDTSDMTLDTAVAQALRIVCDEIGEASLE